jgi:hypothetical protein
VASGSGSGPGDLNHFEKARVGSRLCFYNWTHGTRACKCVAPCFWSGNKSPRGWLKAIAPGVLVHVVDQLTGHVFWWTPERLSA